MSMEKDSNFLESFLPLFNFIKEHLAILLLVPVLIGGIIQLIELSSMSISFIRFFSSTQLLPDGLLVLFIIFICLIMYIIFQFMMMMSESLDKSRRIRYWHNKARMQSKLKIINFTDKKPKDFNHFKRQRNYYNLSIKILIAFLGLYVLVISVIIYGFIQKELNIFSSLALIFIILWTYKYMFSGDNPINLLFWKIKKSIQESDFKIFVYKDFLVLILLAFLILGVFSLSLITLKKIITHFNQQYMLPNKIENFEKIQPKLKDKNYIFSEVTYFNDKYIFIKHSHKDKNITYEIVKLDTLF